MAPATSLGFSVADFARDVLGVELFPWQRWLLIHSMELRPDGKFRFRIVLFLVARQNGKTSLVEIKALWKMYVRKGQILGTALNLDLSEESWTNAVTMAESIPDLNAEIVHVDRTNGKKALRLANGARWKVATASRKGGRGFSADDVNLDELREHYDWSSWGAVTKTTLAKRDPQIWAYSNAGDTRSVVLNDLQDKARAGVEDPSKADPAVFLAEWSAPDGCDIRDPKNWVMANPAYGYAGLTEEALRLAVNTDPEEVFRTECLCQRVPDLAGGAIDMSVWANLRDPESRREGDIAIGVEIAPQRDYAYIGFFGHRGDGLGHVQLLDKRPGTDWILPRMLELRDMLKPIGWAMGRGTFASLEADLGKAGFTQPEDRDNPQYGDIAVVVGADMSAACGQMLDAVRQESLRHTGQQELDAAVASGRTKETTDAVAWSRKDSGSDIGPLVTVTLARWLYMSWAHLVTADYDVLDSVF